MFTENERKSISEKGSLAPTCCQNLGDLFKKMYFSVLFHILGVFFTYQDVLEIKYIWERKRQSQWMLSTKADNDLWRPEGGELKAKQAGVVLPRATQLSLGGGEIGQLLTSASGRAGHTNVGIEGRVAPTGQSTIWLQFDSDLILRFHLPLLPCTFPQNKFQQFQFLWAGNHRS